MILENDDASKFMGKSIFKVSASTNVFIEHCEVKNIHLAGQASFLDMSDQSEVTITKSTFTGKYFQFL